MDALANVSPRFLDDAIIPDNKQNIQFNRGGDDTLHEGDSLILIGDFDHIKKFWGRGL